MNSDPLNRLTQLKNRWSLLLSTPTWHLTVIPEIQAFTKELEREPVVTQSICKRALYDFFEEHLSAGDFTLGQGSGAFDRERKPIDTVVIHHTGNPPGLSTIRLSAIELMRLYGPYFADPPTDEASLKGRPIFSGHERGGKQVFWPYHWMVRDNGHVERLLSDAESGWHAGNWDVNCRSVAIVLDNDYERRRPSDVVLRAVVALIANYYGNVPVERVIGYREVNSKTLCPSTLFLTRPSGKGWKDDLIGRIVDSRHTRAA